MLFTFRSSVPVGKGGGGGGLLAGHMHNKFQEHAGSDPVNGEWMYMLC